MSGKKQAILNFVKRNAYYLVVGVALIATAIIIAAILFTRTSSPTVDGPVVEDSAPTADVGNDPANSESESSSEPEPKEDDKPTDARIIFTVPVKEASVSKDYTSSTVVYNKTLGVYTGHMGMDFSAEAGTQVVAAYTGTVESIVSSYLRGTTVTVDHGNGLKSVYNSIDVAEGLAEGQNVVAGQTIGTVSDNNRQEYKDGPHLHFEVTLNGNKVNPETYLMIKEK